MATNANIRFYQEWRNSRGRVRWRPAGILHCRYLWRQPEWVGVELSRMLRWMASKWIGLKAGPWSGVTVARQITRMWSSCELYRPGLMPWRACDHFWTVHVGSKPGEFGLRCHKVVCDESGLRVKSLSEVDWKAG